MPNNLPLPQPRPLSEGLQYRDLEGLLKSTIHVDEFASKMGDDEDVITVSFFVRDKNAARDLMSWFEKGYDFILDSERSPGEIKPNRYLVYIELRRRRAASRQIQEILSDLSTLTEFEPEDWIMHYDGKELPYSEELFAKTVPLDPREYRKRTEGELNAVREAAGLPVRQIYDRATDIRELQGAAGIL